MMQKIIFLLWLNIILLFGISLESLGQTIFVDPLLKSDCNGNYSILNRDCSGSDGFGYMNLSDASLNAKAGASVLIREGVYTDQLRPEHSGDPDNYVLFTNYLDEQVVFTGTHLSPAIWIVEKEYIIIEGLVIDSVRRWLNALGCNNIIIQNNTFLNALDPGGSSKTGIFFQASNHNIIRNNQINNSTQDNIGLVDCDYNIIEENEIKKAVHTLWALKCSNRNIIRNNYFHNEIQKIGEVYDCYDVGYGNAKYPKIRSLADAKYNVIEGNIFAYTASSGNASPYSGIQYAGQYGIIRKNIFYDCTGPAIEFSLYANEALNNVSNKIYNNVFYRNKLGAINISGNTNANFKSQKLVNNIFYKNKFVQNDLRWDWYNELDEKNVQIITGRLDNVSFDNNNIFNTEIDDIYSLVFGLRNSSSNEDPKPISWWEENRSDFISNSLQSDPLFESVNNLDFRLSATSPMIDAGIFLTKTTKSCVNNDTLFVMDLGWFTDGYGITTGDTIMIETNKQIAVIVSMELDKNALILDRSISCDNDVGISLIFKGIAPDLGAFESDRILKVDYLDKKPDITFTNPSTMHITLFNSTKDKLEKVSLFDMHGRFIKEKILNNELYINVENLAAGPYIMKITDEHGFINVYSIIIN